MTVKELYELATEQELLQSTSTHLDTWSSERKSHYIGELFCNIAAACFTVTEEELFGELVPLLIDGYQRLNAIANFYQGVVPCNGQNCTVWYSLATHDWRTAFNSTTVVVRQFPAIAGTPSISRTTFRPAF